MVKRQIFWTIYFHEISRGEPRKLTYLDDVLHILFPMFLYFIQVLSQTPEIHSLDIIHRLMTKT